MSKPLWTEEEEDAAWDDRGPGGITALALERYAAEVDRLRSLLWRVVDAHRIPAKRPSGEDRLLLNIDPDLWHEAADAVGYDEMGG